MIRASFKAPIFRRDAAKLQDEWFADPEKVKDNVGLVEEQPSTRRKTETCQICFEAHPVQEMACARCKHYFCKPCWQGYVHASIENGPSCLDLRCPDPPCKAVVPTSLILSVADSDHRKHYEEFSLRSFVDDNKKIAWCTAPGCTNAAEALVERTGQPLDVDCTCGNSFCFNCSEEAHRPVDCTTVRNWMVKNSAESENMTWILANTKPCPKCNRPIEKNQGCMHMTCSQCRHEFCWLCLGAWYEHGERTGGYYNCNTYKKKKDRGEIDEAEEQRAHARASLERYMHYWQRWAEHDKARKTALQQLRSWETELLELLAERSGTPASQLRFILDAWKEVVSCRRILKWTYAVGYYSFDDPKGAAGIADRLRLMTHKQFFEFTQQDAETALERMNHKVEKQLHVFLRDDVPFDDLLWNAFREELIGFTDVTKSQFAKLVDFLEKGVDEGLAEFETGGSNAGDTAGASGSAAFIDLVGDEIGQSWRQQDKGKSDAGHVMGGSQGRRKEEEGSGESRPRQSKRERASRGTNYDTAGVAGTWYCPRCTYVNQSSVQRCEMCNQRRLAGR